LHLIFPVTEEGIQVVKFLTFFRQDRHTPQILFHGFGNSTWRVTESAFAS